MSKLTNENWNVYYNFDQLNLYYLLYSQGNNLTKRANQNREITMAELTE